MKSQKPLMLIFNAHVPCCEFFVRMACCFWAIVGGSYRDFHSRVTNKLSLKSQTETSSVRCFLLLTVFYKNLNARKNLIFIIYGLGIGIKCVKSRSCLLSRLTTTRDLTVRSRHQYRLQCCGNPFHDLAKNINGTMEMPATGNVELVVCCCYVLNIFSV